MKASDIPDEAIYQLVAAAQSQDGKPSSLFLWDAMERLPQYPEKVVFAKLRQMVAKGRLRGCPCGCRGDYRFPWEEFGAESSEDRANWQERIARYLEKGPRNFRY